MEQHPVPRNISSFQFHLVGDMTLRQFFYLAAGIGIAIVFYKAVPIPIVNIALAGASALGGFAFAFLPIQDRPLDKWLLLFIKSIFSPTQYLWRKEGIPPEILTRATIIHIKVTSPINILAHKEAQEKLRLYLATIPAAPHEIINAAEKKYIDKTLSLFDSTPVILNTIGKTPPSPTPTPIPNISPFQPATLPPTKDVPSEPAVNLQTQAIPRISPPTADRSLLSQQLKNLASEKEALENELRKLQQEMEKSKSPQIIKPRLEAQKEPTIKAFTAKTASSELGLPYIPQIPNIIVGIIKDPQRKLLPNIILTIKDKSGLPLRALKTNKLGQFATATPLPNGIYFLEIEDPLKRFVFDIAEITLSGKIFLPIEIIARGEKELIREQLTKDLFGSANI